MEGASCLGGKTAVFVRKPAVKNGKEAIFYRRSGVPPFGSIALQRTFVRPSMAA
jgi:hypothetical protein